MKNYGTYLPSMTAGGVVADCDEGTVSLRSSIKKQYCKDMYVILGMKWFEQISLVMMRVITAFIHKPIQVKHSHSQSILEASSLTQVDSQKV